MGVLLRSNNINKVFDQRGESVPVLNDISLEIEAGEFVVIMGSSGAGKSTLLYSLSGLDSITSGVTTSYNKEDIGFVFQDFHLIPNLTVLDNILVANHKLDKKTAQKRAEGFLDSMQIKELTDRFPNEISGGEQQRVSISRALINNPQILFADEPTGNLNSSTSNHILDILERENKKGQTIIMVSHELQAAARGSRVIFLKDGRVIDTHKMDLNVSLEERTNTLFNWLTEMGW